MADALPTGVGVVTVVAVGYRFELLDLAGVGQLGGQTDSELNGRTTYFGGCGEAALYWKSCRVALFALIQHGRLDPVATSERAAGGPPLWAGRPGLGWGLSVTGELPNF